MSHQKTGQVDPDTGAIITAANKFRYFHNFPGAVPQDSGNSGFDADRDWEVNGTNMTALTSCVHSTGGGLKFLTAGGDNDQVLMDPNDATSTSALHTMDFSTDDEISFMCMIETDSAIATTQIQVGYSLTQAMDEVTDDDAAMFTYNTDTTDTNWQANTSITGTDAQYDTGIAVAVSSAYILKVKVDAARIPTFYISEANGDYSSMKLVATGAALTTGIDLVPFVGLQALTGSARTLHVRWVALGKNYTN